MKLSTSDYFNQCFCFSVFPCAIKAGGVDVNLWQNDTYDDAFKRGIADAMDDYNDTLCEVVAPENLARDLMMYFHVNFTYEASITLFGKYLVCEKENCDNPHSLLLLEEKPCGDERNPFCSYPTIHDLVKVDTSRGNHDEEGCTYMIRCNRGPGNGCESRFAFVFNQASVQQKQQLELCGIRIAKI